jgi:murein DD-endopeptidase
MDPLSLREVFGLSPLPVRLREAVTAVRGAPGVPGSRFGLSSLRIFKPALSVRTWLGRTRADRRVPISNLFNRTPTPLSEGWSVRKTQVRDFRGGTLTYDSHNGTDFAVPVGTIVTAAAPGKVLRLSSEYNRGGLKLFLDHGDGLATTSNHLARALVSVGDVVRRGQPIALSGYSGIDALVAFPWSVPHVHFNVWLDGEYVDPFADPRAHGEVSLWLDGATPLPRAERGEHDGPDEPYVPTRWDEAGLARAIEACTDPAIRAELASEPALDRRAMNLLFERNYYPTRFSARPAVVAEPHARTARMARLTLPFQPSDFVGIALEA